MKKIKKSPYLRLKNIRINILILLIVGLLGTIFLLELTKDAEAGEQASLTEGQILPGLLIIEGNSIQSPKIPLALNNGDLAKSRIEVIVTAYSSSPSQTDNTPYLTAAGTTVREGVVATNLLPFNTKIRLPELYGDKIFVVEDRMSSEKGYNVDIWLSSYQEAKGFGAKRTYIEILGS
jgi:3D (Asp-Asp-Asp) domain-containing protein